MSLSSALKALVGTRTFALRETHCMLSKAMVVWISMYEQSVTLSGRLSPACKDEGAECFEFHSHETERED